MEQIRGVQSVTVSSTVPGRGFGNNLFVIEGAEQRSTDMKLLFTDFNFDDLYDIGMVAGRRLDEEYAEDRQGNTCVINRSAVRAFGWSEPEQAIDREVSGWGRIVGVMENFHYRSLQEEIAPLAMFVDTSQLSYVSLKLRTDDWTGAISAVQRHWEAFQPNYPFEYFFLDEDFDRQYAAEMRIGGLVRSFAVVAIFVACLGLLGLIAFLTESRTKEIGVRKVIGASEKDIVLLLNRGVTRLILLAVLIATPVAWLLLRRWLADFAHRIEISPGVFILAGLLLMGVAWATSAFLTLRAARRNPVEALRYE